MLFFYVARWAALGTCVSASASLDRTARSLHHSHVLHERHDERHLEGWIRRERADPKALLPMRIGLEQSNIEKGHEFLMDMSAAQTMKEFCVCAVKLIYW